MHDHINEFMTDTDERMDRLEYELDALQMQILFFLVIGTIIALLNFR